jgi:Leucine-rich repeat (LRR) protein
VQWERSYPNLKLNIKITKIGKNFEENMNISPRLPAVGENEIYAYNTVSEKDKSVERVLTSGNRLRGYVVDKTTHSDQLYLCREFIVKLSSNIKELQKTKILQMCCNYLSTLPREIGHLSELQILILARNRINRLPEEIGMLMKLKELNLSQNYLQRLPESISSLKQLEALHIDDNRFTEVPLAVGRMLSLRYLNISKNPITYLPVEVLRLPCLSEIEYDNCDLDGDNIPEFNPKHVVQSLKEICSRQIVKNNLKIHKCMDTALVKHFLGVGECSFCAGPYFDDHYEITVRNEIQLDAVPVVYKLCTAHFTNNEERFRNMFALAQKTFPSELMRNNLPPICDMFNVLSYTKDIQRKIKRSSKNGNNDELVPLYTLTRYLSFTYALESEKGENAIDGFQES